MEMVYIGSWSALRNNHTIEPGMSGWVSRWVAGRRKLYIYSPLVWMIPRSELFAATVISPVQLNLESVPMPSPSGPSRRLPASPFRMELSHARLPTPFDSRRYTAPGGTVCAYVGNRTWMNVCVFMNVFSKWNLLLYMRVNYTVTWQPQLNAVHNNWCITDDQWNYFVLSLLYGSRNNYQGHCLCDQNRQVLLHCGKYGHLKCGYIK